MDEYLIVMAAGSGTRMGSEIPKQFMPLGGKAVLRRTIERFVAVRPDLKVIVVLPSDYVDWWKQYCIREGFHQKHTAVSGGITRFHSVRNALSKVRPGGIVAIHDGVRPLITEDLIERMFSKMEAASCRCLVPVVPSVDTLRRLRKDAFGNYAVADPPVDRSEIFGVQTPQMFRSEDILKAYSQPYDTSYTDDSTVAEGMKIPLAFCEGERFNIKLTTPEDLVLAKAILEIQDSQI